AETPFSAISRSNWSPESAEVRMLLKAPRRDGSWFRAELEQIENMEAKTMKTFHSLIAGLWATSSILARRIALPLLFLGAGLTLVQPCAGAPIEFEETGSLHDARYLHTATLLPNGKVLVAGGGGVASAELYDVGLGFSNDWQPKIQRLKLTAGRRLLLTGSLFQGISQASGGNTQDSSSNYPIVQLRS